MVASDQPLQGPLNPARRRFFFTHLPSCPGLLGVTQSAPLLGAYQAPPFPRRSRTRTPIALAEAEEEGNNSTVSGLFQGVNACMMSLWARTCRIAN